MPNCMRYFFMLVALTLCCQVALVHAATSETLLELSGDGMEDLYGDEEFVSIATGSSKPAYKAPAVASVITAKQIKAMGARNLDEVLETVPGLHVSPSNLNRLNSVYSIRGIQTGFNPQVLLLMNGVPFPLLYSGGHPFNFHLPVAAIERVEIIRGPGSAVYGADAFAGVINIITKNADSVNGTEVGARYGSFDSHDLWLQNGSHLGDLGVMFSLELQKSKGDRDRVITSDLQSAFDPSYSHAPGPLDTRYDVLDLHLELELGDWKLRNWYWRQDDAGLGAGGAQALDPNGHDSVDSYMFDLGWTNNDSVSHWEFSANLSYYHSKSKTQFNLLPAGTTVPLGTDGNLASYAPYTLTTFTDGMIGNPSIVDDQAGIDLTTIFTGIAKHRLRLGGGFRYQAERFKEVKNYGPGITVGTMTDVSKTPYVFMPDTHRNLWYLSVQDEWQLAPDWELTSGLRFDYYSDFGSTVNPRLALVWATQYNLTTKLLYGRAFRAPSFSEQFAQNNPVVTGNPELEPETIDTVELAFDYRPTFNIQTNLSIYGYRAEGLIEYKIDANGISKTAQNARDQQGCGMEFEVAWEASNTLNLRGNLAVQYSEDASTGKRIADAPAQQLMLSADWKFSPNWQLHPQINWVGNRHRDSGDSREQIGNYTLVDLTLRRADLVEGLELAVAVRNLFDEDAREPSSDITPEDYPLEGRNLWAELSYRF